MKRLKSPGHAQRFLATHDQVVNLFSANHRHSQSPPTGKKTTHEAWAELARVAVA